MERNAYPDRELLSMIIQKNERAFTLLFHRYYTSLCDTAYKKMPNEAVVEEIVQDVFIALWNKAAELDVNGDIKSYLFATLRNKILYELRTQMVRSGRAALLTDEIQASLPDASDIIVAKELEEKIQNVMAGMSPQSREAFRLSRFEQMSYKMIAEQLDVSVGTVEKHISKALFVLRKEILVVIIVCLDWSNIY